MHSLDILIALNNDQRDRETLEKELMELAKPIYLTPPNSASEADSIDPVEHVEVAGQAEEPEMF